MQFACELLRSQTLIAYLYNKVFVLLQCWLLKFIGNMILLMFKMFLLLFLVNSLDFDNELIGVGVWPYVYPYPFNTNAITDLLSSYTVENLQTALTVVSSKFSRIFIYSLDTFNVPYVRNFTYYRHMYSRGRTAEVAARINKAKGNLSLIVLIGICDSNYENSRQVQTEFQVALEAAHIANSIFPGTVEGFMLPTYALGSIKWANETLKWVKLLRIATENSTMRVGTMQGCNGFTKYEAMNVGMDSTNIWKLRLEIIQNSDFVMCLSYPTFESMHLGVTQSRQILTSNIIRNQAEMKAINSNVEVMWYTQWPKIVNESAQYIMQMQQYWTEANDFACQNNIRVYIEGAFDNNFAQDQYTGSGWWKLISYEGINNVSEYLEKISELPLHNTKNSQRKFDPRSLKEKDVVLSPAHIGVIISVATLVVLLFGAILYFIYKKWFATLSFPYLPRQEIHNFIHGRDDDTTNDNGCPINALAIKKPYDQSLEISRAKLTILQEVILGGGQYGVVHQAFLKDELGNENTVALKMIRPDGPSTAMKGLLSEIKIMSYLGEHPHIVSILGAYTAELEKGVAYLALEFCSQGSLKNVLKDISNDIVEGNKLDDNHLPHYYEMIQWTFEIASGMEYLEQKCVIHADLATRNVLLTSEGTAKIADFGLSRRLYEYLTYTKTQQEALPWRWMSIESLKSSEFSIKSDVWSYGVTIWEIFSLGAQPYPGIAWCLDFMETLEEGFRLKKPKYATFETFEIMDKCWRLKANDRPSFAEISKAVANIRDDQRYYTKLI